MTRPALNPYRLCLALSLVALCCCEGQAQTLRTSLLAYYKLDAAGVTVDAHAANTLTNTNSVTTTTGKINEAGSFTAASSQNLSATIAGLNSASAYSLSFWAYRTASGNMIIVGPGQSGTARANVLLYTDGKAYVQVANGGTTGSSVAHGVANSAWGHHVLVFDGTQSTNSTRLRYFVNGVEKTLSYTGTIPATLAANASQGAFLIGSEVSLSRYSTGLIDEVGVWNRALTTGEVTSLYNSGSALPYSSFGPKLSSALINQIIQP